MDFLRPCQRALDGAPGSMINAPGNGARIDDRYLRSSIREETENHAFRFPWRERLARTFAIFQQSREERENHAFRFPWSKKPIMDFLRPY
jgi:hypothetical protein